MICEDSKWEEDLPSPEELIPLSQSLISPDLAIAFDLRTPNNHNDADPVQPTPSPSQANSSAEFAKPARTMKRQRLVWTPELHKRFVDAVIHLGIKNAVPKTIMQLMSVDGLTRENVASHLQKYRLYLKRMNSGRGGGGGGNVGGSDHLFASSDHFISTHQQPQTAAADPQFLHRQISAVNFISPTNGKAMDQSLFLARQSQQQQVLKDKFGIRGRLF